MKNVQYIYLLMANIFLGIGGVILRGISLPTEQILFLVGLFGLFFLQIIFFIKEKSFKFFYIKSSFNFVIYVLTCGLLGWLVFSAFSDPKTPVSTVSLVVNSSPFFVTILAPIFLKDSFSIKDFSIALFGILGLCLFITKGDFGVLSSQFSIGLIFALLALALNAVLSILNKKFSFENSIFFIPFGVFWGDLIIGSLFYFIHPSALTFDSSVIFTIILLSLSTLMGFILLSISYKYLSVSTISIFGLIQPVLTSVLGVFLFKEFLSSIEIIGAVIVIGSIFIQINLNKNNK